MRRLALAGVALAMHRAKQMGVDQELILSLATWFFIASAAAIEPVGTAAYAGAGPYLSNLGRDKIYEPAAVSLISFGLTWLAMIAITVIGRGARVRVQIGGAR